MNKHKKATNTDSYEQKSECGNEETNISNEDRRIQYQLNRAKEYLQKYTLNNNCEPTLEYCIISDLLKIVNKNEGGM